MYAQLTSWDNLLLAYRRASKGKRDQPAVAAFEYRLEDHLLALQDALRTHTIVPGIHALLHPRTQTTADLGGAVSRPGSPPRPLQPYRARLRAHVRCRFICQSPGQGYPWCYEACAGLARRFPDVLQCDLRHFFPVLITPFYKHSGPQDHGY